jgi:hypothetical protein
MALPAPTQVVRERCAVPCTALHRRTPGLPERAAPRHTKEAVFLSARWRLPSTAESRLLPGNSEPELSDPQRAKPIDRSRDLEAARAGQGAWVLAPSPKGIEDVDPLSVQ